MGRLARYPADAFGEQCPSGWTSSREVKLAPEIGAAIGCDPRADVCLTRSDDARRIWIEFEISRADPVANHVKFAVAHGFVPQRSGDAFVSMVSSHVDVGRRSLASAAVLLMRQVGMSAFQTLPLPQVAPAEVSALNGLSPEELRHRALPIQPEIDRVLRIVDAFTDRPRYRIHWRKRSADVVAIRGVPQCASGAGVSAVSVMRWVSCCADRARAASLAALAELGDMRTSGFFPEIEEPPLLERAEPRVTA